jgi:hypothetical protein
VKTDNLKQFSEFSEKLKSLLENDNFNERRFVKSLMETLNMLRVQLVSA